METRPPLLIEHPRYPGFRIAPEIGPTSWPIRSVRPGRRSEYIRCPSIRIRPETQQTAITFVGAGTASAGVATASPGIPAGTQENDCLILQIAGEGEDANADSGPSGWTYINTVASNTGGAPANTRQTSYYKIAGASESAPTVPDAGNHTAAVITAWRGVDTTNPINVSATSAKSTASTSSTITGATTTSNGCMVLACITTGDPATFSGWTNSNLVSITEGVDANGLQGSDWSIGLAYGILTTAGATGNTSVTLSLSEESAMMTIALEPAASGTTINANQESIELSTFPASVASHREVAAALESLELTTFAAAVSAGSDTSIAANLEQIEVATSQASISSHRAIAAAQESIEVSTFQAIVGSHRQVSANLESIQLTALGATLVAGFNINASLEQISLQTFPATIEGVAGASEITAGKMFTVPSERTTFSKRASRRMFEAQTSKTKFPVR